jgi:hypothetical protein
MSVASIASLGRWFDIRVHKRIATAQIIVSLSLTNMFQCELDHKHSGIELRFWFVQMLLPCSAKVRFEGLGTNSGQSTPPNKPAIRHSHAPFVIAVGDVARCNAMPANIAATKIMAGFGELVGLTLEATSYAHTNPFRLKPSSEVHLSPSLTLRSPSTVSRTLHSLSASVVAPRLSHSAM